MIDAMLRYERVTPDLSAIRDFFYETDEEFDIPLSQKVDVDEYTMKLYEYSDFYVCFDGVDIAGLICCYTNRPPDAYISHVCVRREYQSRGIFKHMLLHQQTKKAVSFHYQINTISLEVAHKNLRARTVYERLGFVLESEREESSILKLKLVR